MIRATPIEMSTKSVTLAEDKSVEEDDAMPSTSARFRLKMTADGQLVPEIIPVGEDATREDPAT